MLGTTREVVYLPRGNCMLSGNHSLPVSESCSVVEVDQKVGGGIALIIIIVILVLAIIAIVFWKRKREVETKYERLRADAPMDEMDGVDLDDE